MLDGRIVSGLSMDVVETLIGARPLNDHGVLAFRVSFTDATNGIYTAVVPEPTTAMILCGGACALVRRRRYGQGTARE
jgi:hypothetical protein